MSPSNHWYGLFTSRNQIIMAGNLSYANQAFNLFYLQEQHTIIQTLSTNIPFLGEGTKYYTNINTVRKPFQKGQRVRWECFYCRCRCSGRPCSRFTGGVVVVGGLIWVEERQNSGATSHYFSSPQSAMTTLALGVPLLVPCFSIFSTMS